MPIYIILFHFICVTEAKSTFLKRDDDEDEEEIKKKEEKRPFGGK